MKDKICHMVDGECRNLLCNSEMGMAGGWGFSYDIEGVTCKACKKIYEKNKKAVAGVKPTPIKNIMLGMIKSKIVDLEEKLAHNKKECKYEAIMRTEGELKAYKRGFEDIIHWAELEQGFEIQRLKRMGWQEKA